MTRWLGLLWPLAFVLYLCGSARADIGGSVPSPGGCDYPAVGSFGAAFGEYDYACQFPVEENGARWTTLFGGGMWQVTATVGVAFLMFNASVAATSPAGVLRGITYWACPDFSMTDAPNPIGAWKNYLKPKPCKTVAPRPEVLRDGIPPPPPGAPPPPDVPQPIAPPPDPNPAPNEPPPQPSMPQQTNPTPGNPFAPENPGH